VAALAALHLLTLAGCAAEGARIELQPVRKARDAGADANAFLVTRSGGPRDASADAFFINDPAPPQCGPDGERSEADVNEDLPECPSDKNREGCPCEKPGEKVPCWPGKRINRGHGQCTDGVTTCRRNGEFDPSWGPCEGYVLPERGASEGPAACRCFSSGQWMLENLVPCIYEGEDGAVRVTSSIPDDDQGFRCNGDTLPAEAWSGSTLKVDCAGQYELCYTIKAGDVEHPRAGDCVLHRMCMETWYGEPGQAQRLPDLPAWRAQDADCMRLFVARGGYGEMSVHGLSSECDDVDNGKGAPYIFKRTRYCSTRCASQPGLPECKACGTGGSGQF